MSGARYEALDGRRVRVTGAEWHDPAFNDSLVNGISEGWAQMLTSAYAQHIMPFVYDDMNSWSASAIEGMRDLSGFILKNNSPSCGMERVRIYDVNNEGGAAAAYAVAVADGAEFVIVSSKVDLEG